MYDELVKRLRELHPEEFGDAWDFAFACQQAMHEAADAIEELSKPRWIPVTARPMDEEERKEWSEKLGYDIEYDEALIYTSQLPDDGQEVLVCGRYGGRWIDRFENDPDYGCCFAENGDMDGIVAWMPLPEPPKEE